MELSDNVHKAAALFASPGADFSIEPIPGGSINKTYIVKPSSDASEWFVLQRMHSIFTPNLMNDIERITAHLGDRGMVTPSVLKTNDGNMVVEIGDEWWRALSYIAGDTIHAVTDNTNLESAGALIAEFHTHLLEKTEPFSFSLENFHNTEFYIRRMIDVVSSHPLGTEFKEEASFIEKEVIPLIQKIADMPRRVVHADLKISNILFDADGTAKAIIDLDTIMSHAVAVDLGDGLRSWCAEGDEDTEELSFNRTRYDRALQGYYGSASFLTPEERASIPFGLLLITLELASRFITDACLQSYFVLNDTKYKNLYEQNKVRAQNQLSLYRSMKESGIGRD